MTMDDHLAAADYAADAEGRRHHLDAAEEHRRNPNDAELAAAGIDRAELEEIRGGRYARPGAYESEVLRPGEWSHW